MSFAAAPLAALSTCMVDAAVADVLKDAAALKLKLLADGIRVRLERVYAGLPDAILLLLLVSLFTSRRL